MIYDYIVIGTGLGGLGAGLNLAAHNKKVLMLEKNSLPGGLVGTFKKGRFEFDTSPYVLYDYGNNDHIGTLQKLFKRFGLDIPTNLVPTNTCIKTNTKENFTILGNFEEFAVTLESLKEGSIASIRSFIKITKEIHEALKELEENPEGLISSYPSFEKYLGASTYEALTDLKMPKETIDRLCYLWVDIGSPIHKLSFIDFSEYMYKIIFKKTAILNNKSLDLCIKIIKKYQSKGGKLYYNSEVTSIKNEEDYKLVTLKDGTTYKGKHIICNFSRTYALKNLIKDEYKHANGIENARTLSPNGLIVYLGLNESPEKLNLKHHKYYHFDDLNSINNTKKMVNLGHNTYEAVVPNILNPDTSPKNTTILILKTTYYSDALNKFNDENYYQLKEEIAQDLITKFEKDFNLDIQEYIEEIGITTPITIKRYTNSPNGSLMGYMPLGYDNCINRILSYNDELVPGYSFVGAYSLFGSGVENAFYSGYYITEKLLKERSEEKDAK